MTKRITRIEMKNKDKYENKNENKVESQNDEQVEAEAKEDEKRYVEIDREGLSDEEYIAALEEKLGQAIAEAETCKGLTQRLQADFDNYRKRNNSIAEDMKQLGQSIVIEKMLSVLDNCDLARKYVKDEAALTGFNMMESQILGALGGFGLTEVDAIDKDFDAKFMSAVERVKDEQRQGKVVEVLAKGYMLGTKLLRPASVKVGYWED